MGSENPVYSQVTGVNPPSRVCRTPDAQPHLERASFTLYIVVVGQNESLSNIRSIRVTFFSLWTVGAGIVAVEHGAVKHHYLGANALFGRKIGSFQPYKKTPQSTRFCRPTGGVGGRGQFRPLSGRKFALRSPFVLRSLYFLLWHSVHVCTPNERVCTPKAIGSLRSERDPSADIPGRPVAVGRSLQVK